MAMGLHDLIGMDAHVILWWQMVIRALCIFFAALLLVRLGSTRIYGKLGSLDIVLSIILGSTLSRALTANAPFVPTLAAALTLVLVYLLLIELAMRSRTIGRLINGCDILLIEDGKILPENLKKAKMTERDLLEELRTQGGVESAAQVKHAYLERNGNVSIIK